MGEWGVESVGAEREYILVEINRPTDTHQTYNIKHYYIKPNIKQELEIKTSNPNGDRQQTDILIRQTLIDTINSAINLITSKITSCVNKYNKTPHTIVKNKLHDTITIPLTGSRIG